MSNREGINERRDHRRGDCRNFTPTGRSLVHPELALVAGSCRFSCHSNYCVSSQYACLSFEPREGVQMKLFD